MKPTKHEINGYIYVTSEEYIGLSYYLDGNVIREGVVDDKDYWEVRKDYKKIILTDNPNLPIQQLTTEEVEYLKSVDSFEVKKEKYSERFENDKSAIGNSDTWGNRYKILIPQETEKERGITITNVSEQPKGLLSDAIKKVIKDKLNQPKESIEEVVQEYAKIYRCPATNDNEYCKHDIISAINFGYNHAKQTMYTEDEVINFVEEYNRFLFENSYSYISFKEWFNKHKKQ